MKSNTKLTVVMLCAILAVSAFALAAEKGKPPKDEPKHPISLEILNADYPETIATQVMSGWPLEMRLSANEELGIGLPGTNFVGSRFPIDGQTGFLAFADPDYLLSDMDPYFECSSWTQFFPDRTAVCCVNTEPTDCTLASCTEGEICDAGGVEGTCEERYRRLDIFGDYFYAESSCEINETYVEFTPDIDQPGMPDVDTGRRQLPPGSYLPGPLLAYSTGNQLAEIGPYTAGADTVEKLCSPGFNQDALSSFFWTSCSNDEPCRPEETCEQVATETDGYGYGVDDDLPGLVILADTGVGLVLDSDPVNGFSTPSPVAARNLAGFVNSVGYELNDVTGRTSILASMIVPSGLFSPLVLGDNCVEEVGVDDPDCGCSFTASAACTGDPVAQIDGGEWTSYPNLDSDLRAELSSKIVTIRAFVVNGIAPLEITDINGDHVVDAKDAALSGFQLLSGEQILQFRSLHEEQFPVMLFDYDGNGTVPIEAPPGAGRITGVPR